MHNSTGALLNYSVPLLSSPASPGKGFPGVSCSLPEETPIAAQTHSCRQLQSPSSEGKETKLDLKLIVKGSIEYGINREVLKAYIKNYILHWCMSTVNLLIPTYPLLPVLVM